VFGRPTLIELHHRRHDLGDEPHRRVGKLGGTVYRPSVRSPARVDARRPDHIATIAARIEAITKLLGGVLDDWRAVEIR
jgi:hypothetical protein